MTALWSKSLARPSRDFCRKRTCARYYFLPSFLKTELQFHSENNISSKRPHFPAFHSARYGHVTQFWPIRYQQKCYTGLLERLKRSYFWWGKSIFRLSFLTSGTWTKWSEPQQSSCIVNVTWRTKPHIRIVELKGSISPWWPWSCNTHSGLLIFWFLLHEREIKFYLI